LFPGASGDQLISPGDQSLGRAFGVEQGGSA
jgi:hypothetical protein